jgi:hypothetical protein
VQPAKASAARMARLRIWRDIIGAAFVLLARACELPLFRSVSRRALLLPWRKPRLR